MRITLFIWLILSTLLNCADHNSGLVGGLIFNLMLLACWHMTVVAPLNKRLNRRFNESLKEH